MIQQSKSLLQPNYDTHRYSNYCCARTPTRHQMSRHKFTSRNCHLNHHNHARHRARHRHEHNHHRHHHHHHHHHKHDDDHQRQQHNIHIDHIDERLRFSCCQTPRFNYTTQSECPINEPIKMNYQVRVSATIDTNTTTASAKAITPVRTRAKISPDIGKKPQTLHLMRNIFIIILLNFTFSHLKNSIYHTSTTSKFMTSIPHLNVFESFPRIVQVAGLATPQQASATECITDVDCDDKDKMCLENKCTCRRDRPIEDKDRAMCLNQAVFGEPCHMNEQCLGNSQCLDGICSCANEAVTIFNPSTKINYCHPKRRLNEQCSHDTQCPENAFCANKGGCLCQNGYGPQTVKSADGTEANECLPKVCSSSSECESEFHQCEDNKCKCLATHFDPDKATCYMFGSTGGKPADEGDQTKLANLTKLATDQSPTDSDNNDNSFTSILKDLTANGDRQWLVWTTLIVLGVLLVLVVFLVLRRHYRGYCWTKHKIGYEPNNANHNGHSKRAARDEVGDGADEEGGLFSKNSITNKSFRRRRDDEADDYNEDDTLTSPEQTKSAKLNLVGGNNNKKKTNNKARNDNINNGNGCDPLINQKVFVSQTNGANGNNMIKNSNSKMMTTTTTTNDSHNNDDDDDDDGVGGYVKVDMNNCKKDVDDHEATARNNHKQQRQTTRDPITNGYYNQAPFHKVISPLASSTSTAV